MGLVEYAKSELDRIPKDGDGMQDRINRDILELVEKFGNQGHSGFSASYALNKLERLLRFKPINSLTGADDEWNEIYSKDGVTEYQNRRCASVFKKMDSSGNTIKAYDIDGVVVSDNGGITWFSSKDFEEDVTFPYYPPIHPKRVYIEYTEDVPPGFTGDKYEVITDQPERIKALYERKRREFDEGEK